MSQAQYTWDVFSTLDGYGSYKMSPGNREWGGYWGKQGSELLEWRSQQFDEPQHMIFGANTFRENAELFSSGIDPLILDEWNQKLLRMRATVISSTITDNLGWQNATVQRGDGVQVIREIKETSEIPLRSQASLTLNWALLEAGLVDRIEVTIFPVISGRTGISPILRGAGDFDLELVESHTFDKKSQVLIYRPTPR